MKTAVDLLWNLIPKDTQSMIEKQFDGYNKAKEMERKELDLAYQDGREIEHIENTIEKNKHKHTEVTNEQRTKQTTVESIIQFCQEQMDNDSSIHKGVYLSIIKFCKEQITEESEIHWKTTLFMMTNNKQKTAVEHFSNKAYELFEQYSEGKFDRITLNKLMLEATEEAKETENEQMLECYLKADVFPRKYEFEKWYNETYGGNK